MYDSYYYSSMQTDFALTVVAVILAIAATVLVLIFVTPEKRRASLNRFFQVVADIFNFKGLLLENIAKTLYIFLTLFSILSGFFTLFRQPLNGLLMMILLPIVWRILFEFIMMTIILVKNVIQLNNKIPNHDKKDKEQESPFFTFVKKPEAPAPVAAPTPSVQPPVQPVQPDMVFCAYCGTQYDKNQGGCPNGCPKPPVNE